MKISLSYLEKAGACEQQRREFAHIFGEREVEISVELAVEHSDRFSWMWAAHGLLPLDGYRAWMKATTPARDKRDQIVDSAWHKTIASVVSDTSKDPWDEYDVVAATAWVYYSKVAATTWVECALKYGLKTSF